MSRTKDTHRLANTFLPFGAVASIGRRLDVTGDAAERARLLGEYEDARARALHARLALLIQREAIGLRRHRAVEATYPEPPRRS